MNESTASSNCCPKCGVALPSDATAGLCPRCLMAEAMVPTQPDAEPAAAQKTLAPEELAPHFPQLEILECLGRGGMGVVYKARQKTLNRFVALKLLAPERVREPKFAERFTREAQALAALNHPNIVTIYDFGQAGGFYFLLMEFVDGLNLRQLLRARKFTPEEALAVVPPLCDALQFAHDRGIVHRDIKPENLMLDKAGRVKVADFGIAKMIEPEAGRADPPVSPEVGTAPPPGPTGVVGTPSYSAPEQKTDPQRVDSRADIYSLGVVFYEMLTGELPGKRLEPPSRKVQIDVRLDEVVLRALEQNPALRYQQASEVKTMVETIVGSGSAAAPAAPVGAPPTGTLANNAAFGVPASAGPVRGAPPTGSAANKSGLVRVLEIMFGSAFASPLAIKLINISALGFLGFLASLGFIPLPGWQRCFGFSGFFGFFGLIGFAFMVELANRRKAKTAATKPNPRPSVQSWLARKRISYVTGGIAAALVCAFLLAILFHEHAARNGQWRPQLMSSSAASVQNPLAAIRVTAVERANNIVIFKIVSDPGFPAHLITAGFKGPPITNMPKSDPLDYSGPPLSCLLAPSETGSGWGDGTIFTGESLDTRLNNEARQRPYNSVNKRHGPGEFVYGFYLPDGEKAEMALKQARTALLGKTNLVGAADNGLMLFELKRFDSKAAAGKEKWQLLTGTLNISPEFDLSFSPVIEKVLAINTNGQTGCLDLVSGSLVPLPKYALGGILPPGAKVPPSADLPSGVGIYKRWPDDAAEGPSIYATGGTVLRHLSNEQWEEMSAAQVLTVSGTIRVHPDPMNFLGWHFPATFVFKTPTRTAGLLRVVGTNANPPSVNIRYKTVQYGSATKTNSAAAPDVLAEIPVLATAAYSGDLAVRLDSLGSVESSNSAVFSIPESAVQEVVKRFDAGQLLTVEAEDRDGKPFGHGSLRGVDNQIDTATGMLKCTATLVPEGGHLMLRGSFLKIRVVLEVKHGVTLVPFEAIQRDAQGMFVWTIKPDQTVSRRPVQVGTIDGAKVEIQSGLSPGELVVIGPAINNLRDGQKISHKLAQK